MTYYIIARISFLIRVVVFSLTKRSLMPVRLVASRIPFLSAYWFGQHSQLLDKAEKSIDFSSRDISNLYLLIREVSFDQRNLVALNLKNSLISKSAGKLNQNHFAFVDRVQKQGYLILKDCIDSEKIDECLQFFQRNQNLDGQVWPQAMPDWVPVSSPFFCLKPNREMSQTVISIFRQISDTSLLSLIANNALHLYSFNFFGTSPQKSGTSNGLHYVQNVHRDYDGFLCLSFMIPLTAISATDGATILYEDDNLERPIFLEGDLGDVIVFDPFRLHKANPEVLTQRKQLWIRVGEIPNAAMIQDLNPEPYRIEM